MNGKQGLSPKRAAELADALEMSASEKRRFCLLAQQRFARSATQRKIATEQLSSQELKRTEIDYDRFRAISDWYCFAILELASLSFFKSSANWVARSLGIPLSTTKDAIARLQRLGLLSSVKDGLKRYGDFVVTPSDVAAGAGKRFHSQVLEKASQALFAQPVNKRDFAALYFKVRRSDLPEAKAMLMEFRRRFMTEMESGQGHDDLYCLSIQFFSLLEKHAADAQ